jgi:predicted transcriptional regulator
MPNTPFSLRLDPEIRRRLDEEARRVERPASQVAERAIRRYLDGQQELRRLIDEAVADADRSDFVSQEAVHRWMDSWDSQDLPPPEPDIRRRRPD